VLWPPNANGIGISTSEACSDRIDAVQLPLRESGATVSPQVSFCVSFALM
jgi:hypothetical protein